MNAKDLKKRLLSKVSIDTETGCWVWTGTKQGKYGVVAGGRKGLHYRAHRLSYELHHGKIPAGMQVCHSCDNPPCVNPKHLWIGTIADNMADKVAKNRQYHNPGQLNGRAKLTERDIIAIRSCKNLRQQEIAEKYGVAKSLISMIRSGHRWSYLKDGLRNE